MNQIYVRSPVPPDAAWQKNVDTRWSNWIYRYLYNCEVSAS